MAHNNLLQRLLNGSAPRNLRLLIARGAAPIPTEDALELIVFLLKDSDDEIASQAEHTLALLDKEEILGYLKKPGCADSVLEYFAQRESTDAILWAVVTNPSASAKIIESLALSVPGYLLDKILDNRVRILEFPTILENVKKNPRVTHEISRLVQEIETEFFGNKKKEYAVESTSATAVTTEPLQNQVLKPEAEIPLEDLTLEGLPIDADAREAELTKRLSSLSVQEKIKRALFGNREIRAILIRDTNKEVARSVLRSPKLTDNEIETISAMRGVSEDILRDLGNSREWTRSYTVVQNLVKNPKTPPLISQRLLFRLHTRDLLMLSKDRSVPDAVRQNASRSLNQRTRVSQ